MKKISLTIIALLITILSFSQDPIIEQEVDLDAKPEQTGPNRMHFHHFYMGFGFVAGESEGVGSSINYGLSNDFNFGYRYKLRVCNFYSIGYQVNLSSNSYNMKQDSSKTFPNGVLHNKETLTNSNLGIGIYNRFNFGKRGNSIGKFIDIGVYGDWRFSSVHFIKDKLLNGNIVKTSTTKLNYLEDLNYGAYAQIGVNRYVLYAKYRLSNVFNSNVAYAELPRIVVGFQIGLH